MHEIWQAHLTGVVRNRRKLRRVVDVRQNDVVELVELLLHPRSTRGAGHAADLELDAAGVSRSRAHASVSIPPLGIACARATSHAPRRALPVAAETVPRVKCARKS